MTKKECELAAQRAAEKIFLDLDDRSGFEMDDVDPTTQKKMKRAWAAIIEQEFRELESRLSTS